MGGSAATQVTATCPACGERWPPTLLAGVDLPGCPACEPGLWAGVGSRAP